MKGINHDHKEEPRMRRLFNVQRWFVMAKPRLFAAVVGLSLLAMVLTACGTLTGAGIGAGSGAAIGAATGNTKKGALLGTGIGAAGGAIYDATR
jgi:hypothetical protein